MSFSSSWSLRPCSCTWLRTNARSSNITGQFTPKFCSSLAISLNMDFPQRVSKSRCHPVSVLILVMYVDNSAIRHNCEELGQEFEKFVVMTINPGADLDSLPILDNTDNFVVMPTLHLSGSFLTLPSITCHRSTLLGVTLLAHYSKQHLFISRLPDFWFHYLLGITDRKSSWWWNIVCSRLLTSTQPASPLCHLLSISAGFLTRIIGASRMPTISSSTVLRFPQGCDSFQNGGAKHGCDGSHGVGWLFLCVCVGLLACRGTWFSAV